MKDITEKDIEKDLIDHDPSQGFETEIDKPEDDEFQSGQFQRSELNPDNPMSKEFEIEKLSHDEIKKDELSSSAMKIFLKNLYHKYKSSFSTSLIGFYYTFL